MRRDEVLSILRAHRERLHAKYGVKSLALFGSVARDEASPDSDVDLLVEFDRPMGYFGLFQLQDHVAALLGRPVDLGTPLSLKERLRSQCLRSASMSDRKNAERLRDILDAIAEIQAFTRGMGYASER